MTCDETRELMMDILYGEDVRPAEAAGFFLHLRQCADCSEEYLELLGTREMLQGWSLPAESPEPVRIPEPAVRWRPDRWFAVLHKVAAAILMLAGAVFLLQRVGVLPAGARNLNEEQLQRMIHEVVVARQDESLRVIGEALLSIKEELELRDRARIESVYHDIYTMEQRWLETLESRNRRVSDSLDR
jgi:hypothetical protein